MKAIITVIFITWDGIVTQINKKYRKQMEMDENLFIYIQKTVLKRTFETAISRNRATFKQSLIRNKEVLDKFMEECLLLEDCVENE